MKEKIYTITINKALNEGNGCPLWSIESAFDDDAVEYYLGASVMEPSVRTETNKKGFCRSHCQKMLASSNRLSLALSLSTRLEQAINEIKTSNLNKMPTFCECAVCDRVSNRIDECTDNFAWLLKNEPDFRERYFLSEGLCLYHLSKTISSLKKTDKVLIQDLKQHAVKNLSSLSDDIIYFTKKFDYRNQSLPWNGTENSPERVVSKITH